jgi:hypothetical protein
MHQPLGTKHLMASDLMEESLGATPLRLDQQFRYISGLFAAFEAEIPVYSAETYRSVSASGQNAFPGSGMTPLMLTAAPIYPGHCVASKMFQRFMKIL